MSCGRDPYASSSNRFLIKFSNFVEARAQFPYDIPDDLFFSFSKLSRHKMLMQISLVYDYQKIIMKSKLSLASQHPAGELPNEYRRFD